MQQGHRLLLASIASPRKSFGRPIAYICAQCALT